MRMRMRCPILKNTRRRPRSRTEIEEEEAKEMKKVKL